MTLLQPVPDIFNQLHSPQCLKMPMRCIHFDFGHCESTLLFDINHFSVYLLAICGATFMADEFKPWGLTAPIVLPCVREIHDAMFPQSEILFYSDGQVSSRVEYALSRALEHTPSATVIATNFKDIAIFFPPSQSRLEHTFERISTTQPSLALRVLATAYLLDALPAGLFIDVPRPNIEIDEAHRDLRRTRINLHLETKSFLQLTAAILTLIWQHWSEIVQERFNSSVGTNMCQKISPNLSLIPMTRLLLRPMESGSSFHIFAPYIPSMPLKSPPTQRRILRQCIANRLLWLLESLNCSSEANPSRSVSKMLWQKAQGTGSALCIVARSPQSTMFPCQYRPCV